VRLPLALLLLSACGSSGPTAACGTEDGTGCAPESARVDLGRPSFAAPTEIDNPLFPVSSLHSVVMLGAEDGEPLRVEVTLLPGTKTIVWDGRTIEALESQYVAFLGGRVAEVALDWYGQADDGSVWYLGEDVFNYEDGALADTEGTWQAGRDGPGGMIMPAMPRVGDVYRPENVPDLVFEEVTVSEVGVTVDGPAGAVAGAIVVRELHMDGATEDKTFAPGYGEFSTGVGASREAVAVAVPTDALDTEAPADLDALAEAAERADAAEARAAWERLLAGDVPPLLAAQMEDALDALDEDDGGAFEVQLAALDLRLRHRPPAEIDRGRFAVWARRTVADAEAGEPGDVAGDVVTLERVRDRFAHGLAPAAAAALEAELGELRAASAAGDLAEAARVATELAAQATSW
jgi:hypothetical protein